MAFSTVPPPLDHAPFLLRLVTCEKLGIVNDPWKQNRLYPCRAMISSAWMAIVVIMRPQVCWLMTSVHDWDADLMKAWKPLDSLQMLIFSLLLDFICLSSPPIPSALQFSLNLSSPPVLWIWFLLLHCSCHNYQPPSPMHTHNIHAHKCQYTYPHLQIKHYVDQGLLSIFSLPIQISSFSASPQASLNQCLS